MPLSKLPELLGPVPDWFLMTSIIFSFRSQLPREAPEC